MSSADVDESGRGGARAHCSRARARDVVVVEKPELSAAAARTRQMRTNATAMMVVERKCRVAMASEWHLQRVWLFLARGHNQ